MIRLFLGLNSRTVVSWLSIASFVKQKKIKLFVFLESSNALCISDSKRKNKNYGLENIGIGGGVRNIRLLVKKKILGVGGGGVVLIL